MESLDDVLAHYGVPGMKWGVRKKRAAPSGPTPVVPKVVPGKKVKATGGKYHKPAKDAIDAAVARQKAQKSSVDALSNQELQALVKRMNLEQQYSKLRVNRMNPAKKFVVSLLSSVGQQQAQSAANQYAGYYVGQYIKKATVGAA